MKKVSEVLEALRDHAAYDCVEWYFEALQEEVHWNTQEEARIPHLRKLLRDAQKVGLLAADREVEESNARIEDRLDKISEQVAALADKPSRPSRLSRFLRRFSRR